MHMKRLGYFFCLFLLAGYITANNNGTCLNAFAHTIETVNGAQKSIDNLSNNIKISNGYVAQITPELPAYRDTIKHMIQVFQDRTSLNTIVRYSVAAAAAAAAIGTVVVLSVYELYCFAKIKLHQRGLTAPSLQTGFQPL